MNVSGSEPLIISALNAARHTLHWLLAASDAHKDPPSLSLPLSLIQIRMYTKE